MKSVLATLALLAPLAATASPVSLEPATGFGFIAPRFEGSSGAGEFEYSALGTFSQGSPYHNNGLVSRATLCD